VFGLFAILGRRFSRGTADISDARLWGLAMNEHYGPLEAVSRRRIQDEKITAHGEDMRRLAGSWQTGRLQAGTCCG
jgi:TnpA family transposase